MPKIRSNLSIPLSAIGRVEDDKMEVDEQLERRKATSFRPLCIKCGVFGAQDGSGYAEFGNTRVLAQVTGPNSDGKWEGDEAKISVHMKGVDDSRVAGIRAQLKSSVTAVIFAAKYPGKVIDVEVTVISDDGGVLSAALTAVTLALAHSGIENMGITASCHVMIDKNHEFFTDPSTEEAKESIGGVTFGFVPNLSQSVCVDVYGLVPADKMKEMLEFARGRTVAMVPAIHKAIVNSLKEREKKK